MHCSVLIIDDVRQKSEIASAREEEAEEEDELLVPQK